MTIASANHRSANDMAEDTVCVQGAGNRGPVRVLSVENDDSFTPPDGRVISEWMNLPERRVPKSNVPSAENLDVSPSAKGIVTSVTSSGHVTSGRQFLTKPHNSIVDWSESHNSNETTLLVCGFVRTSNHSTMLVRGFVRK